MSLSSTKARLAFRNFGHVAFYRLLWQPLRASPRLCLAISVCRARPHDRLLVTPPTQSRPKLSVVCLSCADWAVACWWKPIEGHCRLLQNRGDWVIRISKMNRQVLGENRSSACRCPSTFDRSACRTKVPSRFVGTRSVTSTKLSGSP